MSEIIRRERYKIYEHDDYIGYFNVEFSRKNGRVLTADILKHSESFIFLPDKNGHVSHEKIKEWMSERIVPPTRIGIDELLKQMNLSEYDDLEILKFTSAWHTSDSCIIDFSVQV
jgi:hypothetical protein